MGNSQGGLFGRLARTLLVALAVGCAPQGPSAPAAPSPTPIMVGSCEVLVPRELMSGAAPGSPRALASGRFEWGIGDDRLTEAVGEFGVGDPSSLGVPEGSPQRVKVRGVDAVVVPVGDEGIGQIVITWQSGACPYTLWLAPGATIERAADYAARF